MKKWFLLEDPITRLSREIVLIGPRAQTIVVPIEEGMYNHALRVADLVLTCMNAFGKHYEEVHHPPADGLTRFCDDVPDEYELTEETG